ncbi:MAG: SCO family protein [Terriglobales bacterium]
MLATLLTACGPSKPASTTKRYQLTGKVVTIDRPNSSMVVDGDAVPGFMGAMAMPYKVKSPSELDSLSPGDSISAEIVVQNSDYWLEGVRVTRHASAAPPNPTTELQFPSSGEEVPDFDLTNQSGRHISFKQYRGKALLVTFIYTRCPFPDYCPRISGQFAEVNRQLAADAALSGKTHLLSISFDPEHDTPKVLQTYGLTWAGSKRSMFFDHWEFAVPPAAELPKIANFFGLTYSQDSGVISHSLSTAVIGPDGKIFSWYHGSDWQASDLVKQAAAALRPPS